MGVLSRPTRSCVLNVISYHSGVGFLFMCQYTEISLLFSNTCTGFLWAVSTRMHSALRVVWRRIVWSAEALAKFARVGETATLVMVRECPSRSMIILELRVLNNRTCRSSQPTTSKSASAEKAAHEIYGGGHFKEIFKEKPAKSLTFSIIWS